MTRRKVIGRRPLLSADAKGYGSADGRRQVGLQRGLIAILDESADAVGLRRADWERQSGGDGELAVLPADEPENVLIDDFVRELANRLDDHNEDRLPAAYLRLRLALHNGIVEPAANGFAGAGVVVVSRLVECSAARAAQLVAPTASLVVVLSNRVYLDTVAQGHTALRPARFRKVSVQVKEYTDDAWLYVPGHDVHGLPIVTPAPPPPDLASGPAPNGPAPNGPAPNGPAPNGPAPNGPAPTARPDYRAEVISEFHGPVTAQVIGINKGGGGNV